jgi:hypothetical protein
MAGTATGVLTCPVEWEVAPHRNLDEWDPFDRSTHYPAGDLKFETRREAMQCIMVLSHLFPVELIRSRGVPLSHATTDELLAAFNHRPLPVVIGVWNKGERVRDAD